jgi:N-acetylmuramoyl-L-alanine amidase
MFGKTKVFPESLAASTGLLPPHARARRTLLKAGGTLLVSVMVPLPAAAAQILAVRVWPADDYTRVTLENDSDLKATHFIVKDPERLVVDVEGIDLNTALKGLVAKIQSNDPYIKQVRVGQNRPNVVRLVFDLKEPVTPQVFTLSPVGEYKHRLIFDLYPVNPPDLLAALIEKGDWTNGPRPDAVAPLASAPSSPPVAIDSKPRDTPLARDGGRTAERDALAELQHDGAGLPGREGGRAYPRVETPPMTRLITIALDPGHGGEDPGAVGRGGSREKDVVLAIARRLKAKIEQIPNMRVMLTRDADYFVPLHVRVQKARKVQADLFMSIHADAFVEATARGSSVFVLSEKGATSTTARWLANKENSADLIGGVNIKNQDRQLASVLLDLSTTAQINDSMKLARAVLGEIGGINKLHRGAVEQAGFAVLKAPDIPSILIETAFISNPEEEAKLTDDAYQDQMADAVMKGIRRYFSKNPPLSKNRLT